MKLPDFIDKIANKTKKSRFKIFYPLLEAVNTALFDPDFKTKTAPYIRDVNNLKRYIFAVVLALSPLLLLSIYAYGLRVLLLLFISYFVGGITECVFAYYKNENISEGFLVSGLLFVLIFPVTIPIWIFITAILFGTIFGKEVFGGVGQNPFNPALVGRLFVLISWPGYFTTSSFVEPKQRIFEYISQGADSISQATPLTILKTDGVITAVNSISYKNMFFGMSPGTLGEISSFLIILGGVYLILTRVVNFRTPLSIIISAFLFSFFLNLYDPHKFAPPLFHLLSGGLLFGAFYMATDPVTNPDTRWGKVIYGSIMGLLIILLRNFTPLIESVTFSILIMNIFGPLIDDLIRYFKIRREKTYETY
jgi:RnfABCDGE-type electron transport complex D subunit